MRQMYKCLNCGERMLVNENDEKYIKSKEIITTKSNTAYYIDIEVECEKCGCIMVKEL